VELFYDWNGGQGFLQVGELFFTYDDFEV